MSDKKYDDLDLDFDIPAEDADEPLGSISCLGDDYLNSSVNIDATEIQLEFLRVGADYAKWSDNYKAAKRTADYAKVARESLEAELYLHFRNRKRSPRLAPADGGATIDDAKLLVKLDPEYQEAVSAEIEADSEVLRLRGILKAIEMKKDSLISYGAYERQANEADKYQK